MFYCVPLKEKVMDDGMTVMRPHSEKYYYEVHQFSQRGVSVIMANERPATAVDDVLTADEILECAASHIAWWIIYEHEVPLPEVNGG